MPNYKCIKQFKSSYGKVYKEGEIVGARYVDIMKPEEKENFVFFNKYPDVGLTVGLGSIDKHRTAENLGFNKQGGYIKKAGDAKPKQPRKKKLPVKLLPDTPLIRADLAIDSGVNQFAEKINDSNNPVTRLGNIL